MIGKFAGSPRDAREKMFTDLCCPLYASTEIEKLPGAAREQWEKLKTWTPDAGRGLVFVGPSRAGKSRLAWLIAKKALVDLGIQVLHYDALSWSAAVSSSWGDSSKLESWLTRISTVQLLFLDDALKQKQTEAQETTFYGILERRPGRFLPTIITLNSTGQQLKDRMTAGGAADRFIPIMERIKEFHDIITFT
jgi:DNA replication protein DnaC